MDNQLTRLHQFIVDHYDLEELRTLCFQLGVEYDDLRGEGRSGKARELVRLMSRHGRLETLLTSLERERPELFDRAGLSSAPGAVEAR